MQMIQYQTPKFSSTESDYDDYQNFPKVRNKLSLDLQSDLPENDTFSYTIESNKKLPKFTFCGAPEVNFEAHRVNLD